MSSTKNWTEDFSLENGNYQNRCSICGYLFMGYKRRVVCKECSEKAEEEHNKICDLYRQKLRAADTFEERVKRINQFRSGII